MNTYELAEITAELDSRGMSGQCRINTITEDLVTIYKHYDGSYSDIIAAIYKHNESDYLAADESDRYARGSTRAASLANLLDDIQ